MKKLKGYIFSRSFMGERVPQHVQNLVIRDYCIKNSFKYLLSESEYSMEGSYHILKNLINNLSSANGIVAYSIFQLPKDDNIRKDIILKLIKKEKTIHFAVEQCFVSRIKDWEKIDQIWKIKKILPNCLKKI